MSVVRFTMLFHHVTGSTALADNPPVRTGGWSETIYYNDGSAPLASFLTDLQVRRAGLLPAQAAIIGQRFGFADGSSRTSTERFSGSSGESVDVPQMAVLCSARNLAMQSTRRFTLRGIPDAWIVAGELVTTPSVRARFTAFFHQLDIGGFQWKARLRSAAVVDLVGVASTGVFQLAEDLAFAEGGQIRLVRTRDQYGRNLSGTYRVSVKNDARNGTIANWPAGLYAVKGKMQLVAFQYPSFIENEIFISRSAVRKVGRSFFQYRGRASRRRR